LEYKLTPSPEYKNTAVIFLKFMHGDADAYTHTELTFIDKNGVPDIEEALATEEVLGFMSICLNNFDKNLDKKALVEILNKPDNKHVMRFFSNDFSGETLEERIAEFVDNGDLLGWERDCTCSDYFAQLTSIELYYFNSEGVRHTITCTEN
jgi:hypothetical protein